MAELIAGLTFEQWRAEFPLLGRVCAGEEVFWINPRLTSPVGRRISAEIDPADINEADRRLCRFAPYLALVFPETESNLSTTTTQYITLAEAPTNNTKKLQQEPQFRLLILPRCVCRLPK